MRRPPRSDPRRPNLLVALLVMIGFALAARATAPARRGRHGSLRERRPDRRRPTHDTGGWFPRPASPGVDGRGRRADAPTEVPPRGWKDILWRTYKEIVRDRLPLVAAGVTFFVLLALFPAITAFVSLYGLIADPMTVASQLETMQGFLPGGALDTLGEQLNRLARQENRSLGFGLVLGVGAALWTANAGMKGLFQALNVVYDEDEKRGFFRLTLVSFCFTLGLLAFFAMAIGVVVVLPLVFGLLGIAEGERWVLLLRWPALLVAVSLGLSVIYRYGPSREKARWRWVSWGAALAATLWVVASFLFSWYVENFGSYNETYGSLGAVIGFMTWIWISTMIVLAGAELNAETEHQTMQDSTTPPDAPMGRRGARMADTVGEPKE